MNKILGICGGRQVPASRFRVDAVFEELSERGWHCETLYGFGKTDQRISSPKLKKYYRAAARARRAVRTALKRWNGPVFVQRLALPIWSFPELLLASRNDRLVFDFDDAIFRDADGEHSTLRRHAFDRICSGAAHVVAGNSWLAAQVPADVKNLSIIPTCIDSKRYRPSETDRDRNRRVRIGWIGTSGNQKYLKHVLPALIALKQDGYAFDFCMCSDVAPGRGLEVLEPTFIRWSAEDEVEVLQSFDIGIMPLDDTDWCRGKCSFKLIQYMAVGVAVVGSAVGFNNDVVEDRGNGYLVENTDWYAPLSALLSDENWRQDAGRRGREIVLEKFDISIAADRYEAIFSDLIQTS